MSRPTVLIIDDHADDRALTARLLREVLGECALVAPASQAEFTAALGGPAPALAVTDYRLAWTDGLRVVRALKLRWPECPVIMFTGAGDELVAVEGMKVGLDDYVLKSEAHRFRFVPAVRTALDKAEQRHRLGQVERAHGQLLAILEATPDFVSTATVEGRLLYLNRAGRAMAGLSPEEDVTHTFLHDYHAPGVWAEIWPDLFGAVVDRGVWRGVAQMRSRDGRLMPVSLVALAHRARDGQIEYLSLVMRDIGELKRTEDELRESRARLENIINSAMDAIITVDEAQHIVIFNAAAERIFQCPAAAAIGTAVDRFLPRHGAGGKGQDLFALAAGATTGRPPGLPDELVGRRAGGEEFPLEASLSQTVVGGERFLTAILRDIAARRVLEEQLRHAQKMEAIGILAGGVAHDFNNVLGVILGYSQLLLTEHRLDEASRNMMQAVNDAGRRGANLTRQLLTFSRRHTAHLQPEDLNRCIENLAKMLQRLIGEDVTLALALDPGLPPVHADANMIDQVVMNLAINARDAMARGGRLEVDTGQVQVGAEAAQRHDAPAGAYAVLRVRDTGEGIAPEVMGRIFEPFFTTKPEGKGTGLGLSTVLAIMRQHRGWIEVNSAVGRGTEFRAYFPLSAGAVRPIEPAEGGVAFPQGHETVLLVEDDPAIRTMIGETLALCGYRVQATESAAAAKACWHTHAAEIDLVVTDVVMPDGVSGFELAADLAAQKAGLNILFMSGYSAETVKADFVLEPGVNFLTKPFMLSELLAAIRRNLDRRPGNK